MQFTAEQIASYHQNGFVAGPKVLTDEQILCLRQRFDDVITGRVESLPVELRGQAPKGNLKGVKMVNVMRHDAVFRDVLLNNRGISQLAHDLLEGPVRVWQDQAIMKAPHDTATGLAWHQDYVYNDQIAPAEWCTCWIAIDDAYEANGCMKMIPGSHRWPVHYSREEAKAEDMDWLLRRPDIPPGANRKTVTIEVQAGHCHFHHCKLFHGSYGNSTDNPRRAYIPILIPGHTVKVMEDWNPGRHASIKRFAIGDVIEGPEFPELARPEPGRLPT
ncbi:MAG: phytanoyl-CoA dioxygenase family protein [Opitutaceae bacterium]|nr:phytanoyl-CoA dioxygenase family protein [Opitutaceae bacterium]